MPALPIEGATLSPTPRSVQQLSQTTDAPPQFQSITQLVSSYTTPPTIAPTTITDADWYRLGNQPTTLGGSGPYVSPRQWNDFDETNTQQSSIRLIGTVGTGSAAQQGDLIPAYTKFILEGMMEAHEERTQIVETFGDFYVFFFGERPPIYTFNGCLINTVDFDWVNDFMFYYENFLRGTKCVAQNAQILFTYGGRQVEGFMLRTNNATVANREGGVDFSFNMVITDRRFVNFSIDFSYIVNGGVTSQNATLVALLNKVTGGSAGTGSSAPATSQASVLTNSVMNAGSPAAGVSSVSGVA